MSLRLDPAGRPDEEMRALLLEQVVAAGETLMGAFAGGRDGVHEARKRIKRIRAILALTRSADPAFARTEDRRWRDTARLLAGPREAAALVETVERFAAEFPEANRRGEIDAIRDVLAADREAVAGDAVRLQPAIGAAILSCTEAGAAVREWRLPTEAGPMACVLAKGVRRSWKEAEAAAALASRKSRVDDFHDLRKAVKRHAAHLALLRELWPRDEGRRRRQSERLGELLGELNDIHVLAALIGREPSRFPDETARAFFAGLLDEKAKALAAEAEEMADGLFAERPAKLRRRLRQAFERHGEDENGGDIQDR